MRDRKIFSSLMLLFAILSAQGIDFTRVNMAWQYDPLAEIELQHRVIQQGDVLTVFLQFQADAVSKWSFDFLIQENYESEGHAPFESFAVDTLFLEQGKIILKLRFIKTDKSLLVLEISGEEVFYYYDIQLKNGMLPFPSIYLENEDEIPIFEKYLNTSDFRWRQGTHFYAQAYKETFPPATPPMAEMKPLAPSVLPDSSFYFSNPVKFTNDFFYVVSKDSTSSEGVTILKASPYFPEFKRLDELVAGIHYILNEREKKGLKNSKNLKQSFDSFWLETYSTKFRARNAIRNYFNWIEQANEMFTDFKQGWKTDRGMLFIVYGVPDEVYRSKNNEEWFYDSGPTFEFTIISTFFASRTYALRRSVDCEEEWVEHIAAIRKGSNE